MSAKTRKEPCEKCKHRAVVVAPGTPRQVVARYKAAWDACYGCADRLRGLIVAWLDEHEKCIAEPNIGHMTPHAEALHAEAARIRGAK